MWRARHGHLLYFSLTFLFYSCLVDYEVSGLNLTIFSPSLDKENNKITKKKVY